MSKFNAGDIIAYIAERSAQRVVLGVNDADYRISGLLSEQIPSNGCFNDSQDWIDRSYELVIAAPTSGIKGDAHAADVAEISRQLSAKAREKGWCPEYENFVAQVNESLTVKLVAYPMTTVRTTARFIVDVQRTDDDVHDDPDDWADDRVDNTFISAGVGWEVINQSLDSVVGVVV